MNRCLYCYEELNEKQCDFHPSCSLKIFYSPTPPILPYTRENIVALATQKVLRQMTITGVQAKLSVDIERNTEQTARFTFLDLWGGYILKPQTEMYAHLPELEDLTMHLATIAKIHTVPHSLIRFEDNELCYITRRIDRADAQKYLMEDMCQLAERLTEYKYKGSYEQIAKLIMKYSSVPKLDLVNYWEQLLFCWLTGNADMHLKNFSLYSISEGIYSLSPAYDMLSTSLVMPNDKEELALTLNGKKRKLRKSDFESSFSHSGLGKKVIENIFLKFERIIPLWIACIDKSFLPLEMREEYKGLINTKHSILNN